jgi:hypothetical protein
VLDAGNKLGKIVVGMRQAVGGEIPVTLKLRTGIKDGKNNAHSLMPRLVSEFGASALTVRAESASLGGFDSFIACISCMGAHGSKGTPNWLIGDISSSVWRRFVPKNQRTTVCIVS